MNARLLVLLLVALATPAAQAQLYGANGNRDIFEIDTSTGAGTLVGTLESPCTTAREGLADIEYDPVSRRSYAQIPIDAYAGFEFGIRSGQATGACIHTTHYYSAFETVDGAWYAVVDYGGELNRTELFIFDPFQSPAGALVGETGVGHIAGLAYDDRTGVMYGIEGDASASDLYTIDLATGHASVVGNTGIEAGGLQFGADGQLYGGSTGFEGGKLYRIDTQTAQSALVGDTGFGGVNGLTLVPPGAPRTIPVMNRAGLVLLIALLVLTATGSLRPPRIPGRNNGSGDRR